MGVVVNALSMITTGSIHKWRLEIFEPLPPLSVPLQRWLYLQIQKQCHSPLPTMCDIIYEWKKRPSKNSISFMNDPMPSARAVQCSPFKAPGNPRFPWDSRKYVHIYSFH